MVVPGGVEIGPDHEHQSVLSKRFSFRIRFLSVYLYQLLGKIPLFTVNIPLHFYICEAISTEVLDGEDDGIGEIAGSYL